MRSARSRHVHVVGAGLAGLAAALDLSEQPGIRVTIHEGSPKAGGRCRSYHDAQLDRWVDNGNHLILSGNRAVLDHARRIGAADRLVTMPDASFPFADLADGRRWRVRVPASPLSLAGRDVLPPGAGPLLAAADVIALLAAGRTRTVAEAVRGRGTMWRAFWVPMTTAVLNAPPERASAALLRATLVRTFLRGGAACRPVLAPGGLGAALIDPAVDALRGRGAVLRLRAALGGIDVAGGRATALRFGGEAPLALGPDDAVVLAVPPSVLAGLMPDLRLPGPGLAILNAHFRVAPDVAAAVAPLTGLIAAEAQWVFRRGDVLSVTVSAAEGSQAWSLPRDEALALLWSEVRQGLAIGEVRPQAQRLVRERGATFDQSPAGDAARPIARTALANVVLAGDHVATGLPATLEGAIRSGRIAAALA